MNPLVSIIIISYNSSEFIIDTLESIKDQTYNNIELIISDDSSKDGTVEICNEWIAKNAGRFIRTKVIASLINTGIPANCNRGIENASGDWVKILAGDDLLYPDAIQIYINEINVDRLNEKLVFHGDLSLLQDNELIEEDHGEYGEPAAQKFNQEETSAYEQNKILLRYCPVYAPTAIMNRTLIQQIGNFDERFKFWEDRPMWLKITSRGVKMHFVNKKIAIYRRHSNSVQEIVATTLFSRTMLSMDAGYKELIIPQLPFYERSLFKYLIFIRGRFYRIFKNRKTLIINILYKSMIYLAEKELLRVQRKYTP